MSLFYKKETTSVTIFIYFSLVILLIVSVSLHVTFGKVGIPKYSPTKASICFLINGVNSTDVGLPIP
nr:MAG TPA: hypothetical protein [Caudoviricetes sp.]DAS12186.1 MAG TPA: hypothetical protein [Caudoviricetes sp.]